MMEDLLTSLLADHFEMVWMVQTYQRLSVCAQHPSFQIWSLCAATSMFAAL